MKISGEQHARLARALGATGPLTGAEVVEAAGRGKRELERLASRRLEWARQRVAEEDRREAEAVEHDLAARVGVPVEDLI